MLKNILFILSIGFVISGCATWSGIKQDSAYAWEETRKTVHNATSE